MSHFEFTQVLIQAAALELQPLAAVELGVLPILNLVLLFLRVVRPTVGLHDPDDVQLAIRRLHVRIPPNLPDRIVCASAASSALRGASGGESGGWAWTIRTLRKILPVVAEVRHEAGHLAVPVKLVLVALEAVLDRLSHRLDDCGTGREQAGQRAEEAACTARSSADAPGRSALWPTVTSSSLILKWKSMSGASGPAVTHTLNFVAPWPMANARSLLFRALPCLSGRSSQLQERLTD